MRNTTGFAKLKLKIQKFQTQDESGPFQTTTGANEKQDKTPKLRMLFLLFSNLNSISVNLSLLPYNERKGIRLGYVRSRGLIRHMATGPGIIILANMDTFWTLLLTPLSATATSAVLWQQEKKDGKAIKFAHASRRELSVQSQLAWLGNEMAF